MTDRALPTLGAPGRAYERDGAPPPAGEVRVLLVEDDASDAELVADLLGEDPAAPAPSLTWVRRLSAARAALAESRHDVVLLDLSLPDATGLEAVEALCAEHPELPIVVTTGLADDVLAARAVHAGAQDYLVKGAEDVRGIRRAIRYAIERQALVSERAGLLRRERDARAAAEEAGRRASFLAAASAALAGSLDYRTTLAAVTELAVPTIADCAVALLPRDDGMLEPLEWSHRGCPNVDGFRALLAAPALDQGAAPVAHAAFTEGRTIRGVLPPSGESVHGGFPVARMRALGVTAFLVVPLRIRGRSLGVLSLAACGGGRSFSEADVLLAEALADRAAAAVENARLYGEARRAVEVRDEVLGIVSHDLRNPLSAIAMATRGLRTHADGEVAQLGEMIGRSATWSLHIIRDLLDVTAIEAGRLRVHPELMTVTAILESTASMFGPLAQERGVELTFAREPDARWIEADVDRLVQALGNLVGNAIKFAPRGGHVSVSVTADGAWLRFRVADDGPGIAPEDVPHLFDRFWQARRARRGGVGLGLAITRGIVDGHGGRVEVESTVGEGSAFTVVLPAPSRQPTASVPPTQDPECP